jgi:peptidyl-prolyl cis-trans isomerase D
VLERGQNSPIVPLGDERAVVVRVTNHKPAEPRPIAEVRAQIDEQLKRQAMRDAATKQGEEALARLQQGGSWANVMSELKLQPAGRRFVTRSDQVVPMAVIREAFQIPPAEVSAEKPRVAGTLTDDGNYAVWSLSVVRAPDAAAEPAEQRNVRQQQTSRQIGNEEFATYLADAESKADIEKNLRVFE